MTIKLVKLVALLLCLAVGLWAADPWLGTWKLNVAKSKLDPGSPLKSSVTTTEMVGDQMKKTMEPEMTTGEKLKMSWIGKLDGRDYPVQGAPFSRTLAVRVLSPTVREEIYKSDGRRTITARGVLAKDGKSMTWRIRGTNTDGSPATGTFVFEKQ